MKTLYETAILLSKYIVEHILETLNAYSCISWLLRFRILSVFAIISKLWNSFSSLFYRTIFIIFTDSVLCFIESALPENDLSVYEVITKLVKIIDSTEIYVHWWSFVQQDPKFSSVNYIHFKDSLNIYPVMTCRIYGENIYFTNSTSSCCIDCSVGSLEENKT